MLECFYPDQYLCSAYQIDYQSYYDMGYRGITASYSISELLTKKATLSLAKANETMELPLMKRALP